MKASKAAQNWSRTASRSIRISCRAPGMTMALPTFKRAANRSIAGVSQIGSAPAATTSVGTRTWRGKLASPKRAMKRKAASSQATVGAPIAPEPSAAAASALRA